MHFLRTVLVFTLALLFDNFIFHGSYKIYIKIKLHPKIILNLTWTNKANRGFFITTCLARTHRANRQECYLNKTVKMYYFLFKV